MTALDIQTEGFELDRQIALAIAIVLSSACLPSEDVHVTCPQVLVRLTINCTSSAPHLEGLAGVHHARMGLHVSDFLFPRQARRTSAGCRPRGQLCLPLLEFDIELQFMRGHPKEITKNR